MLKPAITVILQGYNNEGKFVTAIESILNQSFSNFELVIVNDGSTDNTLYEVNKLTDQRIKLIRNLKHTGKYASFNIGLRSAKGKYTCFMDSDNICMHRRLDIQLDFMESHPKVGCVGAVTELISNKGNVLGISRPPFDFKSIQVSLLKENCVNHSSLMFRTSFFKKHGLIYNTQLHNVTDYDFIVRASRCFPIRNIDAILIKRILYAKQMPEDNFRKEYDSVRLNQLKQLCSEASKEECSLHLKLMRENLLTDSELKAGLTWLNKLLEENEKKRLYNSRCLYNLFGSVLTGAIEKINTQKNIKAFLSRTDLINRLIQQFNYNSYLEIGVNRPELNFDNIRCKNKTAVDPVPLRTDIFKATSDEYFNQLNGNTKFDLIFIDGLHHYEQVARDINNALLHLNEAGTIVCHDMLPQNEQMQIVPRQTSVWTGDCWKAWAYFRMKRKDLNMFVVNTDFGLGIITKGKQQLFVPYKNISQLKYSFFKNHKHKLMNMIETNAFLKTISQFNPE